jgi:hypothetical protein
MIINTLVCERKQRESNTSETKFTLERQYKTQTTKDTKL